MRLFVLIAALCITACGLWLAFEGIAASPPPNTSPVSSHQAGVDRETLASETADKQLEPLVNSPALAPSQSTMDRTLVTGDDDSKLEIRMYAPSTDSLSGSTLGIGMESIEYQFVQ